MTKTTIQAIIHIAGVDEAGRGPLAGPVYAAAVILPPNIQLPGLTDSKKMSEKLRNKLFDQITQCALAYAIAKADTDEIDTINILQASFLAMQRAVSQLKHTPDEIWVDGNAAPKFSAKTRCFIGGDATVLQISAASVLAKVARDREMLLHDATYPNYGFAQHKGYGTQAHMTALNLHGPCAIHRKTFAPVRALLAQSET
jgi:ribonuclease HII